MFGDNQIAADPRDGLILFGPYEKFQTRNHTIRAGVIGTKEGIKLYKEFVETINSPIISTKWNYQQKSQVSDELQRPSFPGFNTVFDVHWSNNPELEIQIDALEIQQIIKTNRNKKKRTNTIVDLYLSKIVEARDSEDSSVDIWFVIVPRKVWETCRPNSAGREISKGTLEFYESSNSGQLSMFDDSEYLDELEHILHTSSDFHHLFKARLIQEKVVPPIQIFVEPKLRFRDILSGTAYEQNMKAHLAWTVSTTVYYKLGKLPWKLSGVRDGVCYIGLVFKKLNDKDGTSVCSAAQMFLKDGDGAVFRGNIGLWESSKPNVFHLDEKSAFELLDMALKDYLDKWNSYPKELFIHGRVEFDDNEWNGFERAIRERGAETILVGVVIRDKAPLKLFREAPSQQNKYGVLRGIAIIINNTEGYLNTRGFVPRLNTALSMEIPNPLHIRITRGNKDIETVLRDILSLTKLNYNACIYGDGKPVTLSFSDNIGGILTSTDKWKVDTRQFKYYI